MDKYHRSLELGNLYKDELFIIPDESSLELHGEYQFPLLFVLAGDQHDSIPEEAVKFINSVLKQIPPGEMTLKNIGIVYLKHQESSFAHIMRAHQPKHILTWGTEKLIKGLPYQSLIPQYLGSVGIIQCPEITQVRESKEDKIKLWQSMKVIFNIAG